MAATLLVLMFSTDTDEVVERKAFFGSLVFETVKKKDGAMGVTTGVDNPVPIVLLFVVLTLVLAMIHVIYQGLKQRREQLLSQSGS
ncbi:hypothetical protein [Streptomyces sp. YIM 130001]|uniref:hypothetical protein n=1 Tax=Streptomyces sp. YIM 130001 TaxID=2259644 RepID=UPI000E65ADDF|nr:hypothetical protein [Streptomyces sp. YIM 130001]